MSQNLHSNAAATIRRVVTGHDSDGRAVIRSDDRFQPGSNSHG